MLYFVLLKWEMVEQQLQDLSMLVWGNKLEADYQPLGPCSQKCRMYAMTNGSKVGGCVGILWPHPRFFLGYFAELSLKDAHCGPSSCANKSQGAVWVSQWH